LTSRPYDQTTPTCVLTVAACQETMTSDEVTASLCLRTTASCRVTSAPWLPTTITSDVTATSHIERVADDGELHPFRTASGHRFSRGRSRRESSAKGDLECCVAIPWSRLEWTSCADPSTVLAALGTLAHRMAYQSSPEGAVHLHTANPVLPHEREQPLIASTCEVIEHCTLAKRCRHIPISLVHGGRIWRRASFAVRRLTR
jgi:hypothetical protein